MAVVLTTGGAASGRSAGSLFGLVTPRRLARRATELWAPRRRGCAVVLRALETAHPELWRARNDWEALVLRAIGVGTP